MGGTMYTSIEPCGTPQPNMLEIKSNKTLSKIKHVWHLQGHAQKKR